MDSESISRHGTMVTNKWPFDPRWAPELWAHEIQREKRGVNTQRRKDGRKTISCKISPVYVGPGRVRGLKAWYCIKYKHFFLPCSPLWEYLVNSWAPHVSLSTWVSSINSPQEVGRKWPHVKNWGPESKSDSQNYNPWLFWSFVQGLLHHTKLPEHKKVKGKQKFLQFHPSILLWDGGEYFLALFPIALLPLLKILILPPRSQEWCLH